MGNLGSHAASVGLYKNLSYDPRVDFEPVMLVATTPMVLVVRKNLQTDTLKEFIAYALANPRKVTFGSALREFVIVHRAVPPNESVPEQPALSELV